MCCCVLPFVVSMCHTVGLVWRTQNPLRGPALQTPCLLMPCWCGPTSCIPCCACGLAAGTGLALYITEFSLFSTWEGPNGRPASFLDETTQADTTVALFRLWYGHTAVRGIFMWGWWDANMWVQDAGIYRCGALLAGRCWRCLAHGLAATPRLHGLCRRMCVGLVCHAGTLAVLCFGAFRMQ
jgi:hypothetical protein